MSHTMGILTVGFGGKVKTDVHGTEQPSYMEDRPPGLPYPAIVDRGVGSISTTPGTD